MAHTLNDFDLLGSLVQDLLNTDVQVGLRHVIAEKRHLLAADGVVVERPIASLSHTE